MKNFRKGQGTLEYVIILAAVVGAIIAVAAAFKPKLVNTYDTLGDKMEAVANNVDFSK